MNLTQLNERFEYTKDQGERWTILTNPTGPLKGDCEDYSLTLLWLESNKSMIKFWLNIIFCRYIIWFCTYDGEGHVVMYRRKQGWIDNIQQQWNRELPKNYKLKWPMIAPLVLVKFAYTRVQRWFN